MLSAQQLQVERRRLPSKKSGEEEGLHFTTSSSGRMLNKVYIANQPTKYITAPSTKKGNRQKQREWEEKSTWPWHWWSNQGYTFECDNKKQVSDRWSFSSSKNTCLSSSQKSTDKIFGQLMSMVVMRSKLVFISSLSSLDNWTVRLKEIYMHTRFCEMTCTAFTFCHSEEASHVGCVS